MKFYMNEVPITENIQFTTTALSQESRIFPKITFVASTADCPVSHRISSLWFEMEKVISCSAAQEMFDENDKLDTRMFEFAMLQLNTKEREDRTLPRPFEMIAPVAIAASLAFVALFIKRRQGNTAPYQSL